MDRIPYSQTGMLSDISIREYFKNGIDIYTDGKDGLSFDLDKQLHIGSVDLRFRHLYNRFSLEEGNEILSYELLKNHKYTKPYELSAQERLRINPGEIILTTTLEIVSISQDFAAMITGRSSIARMGIMVHCCQEFIHPGHGQAIPLQIINLSPYPVELDLTVPICQIVFFKLATAASTKYIDRVDAKYSSEKDYVDTKIYEEAPIHEDSMHTVEKHNHIKKATNTFWRIVEKYVDPFLPGVITYLAITPLLAKYVVGKNVSDINVSNIMVTIEGLFKNIPIVVLTAAVLFIIYVLSKRRNGK